MSDSKTFYHKNQVSKIVEEDGQIKETKETTEVRKLSPQDQKEISKDNSSYQEKMVNDSGSPHKRKTERKPIKSPGFRSNNGKVSSPDAMTESYDNPSTNQKLKQQTSSYHQNCNGSSQTRQQSSGHGIKKDRQISSPSSKGVDPITGKSKPQQTTAEQDNMPFPNPRGGGAFKQAQEIHKKPTSSNNNKDENNSSTSDSKRTHSKTKHTNDEDLHDSTQSHNPGGSGNTTFNFKKQVSTEDKPAGLDEIKKETSSYQTSSDSGPSQTRNTDRKFSKLSNSGSKNGFENESSQFRSQSSSSGSKKDGQISRTSPKEVSITSGKKKPIHITSEQDRNSAPKFTSGRSGRSSQAQETLLKPLTSENKKSNNDRSHGAIKSFSKTEKNTSKGYDNKSSEPLPTLSKDGRTTKTPKSKRKSSSSEVTKRLYTQRSSSCSKQFDHMKDRRKSQQGRNEEGGNQGSKKTKKSYDETKKKPSSSEVTKRLYTQRSSSCSKQFDPIKGRRKSQQGRNEEGGNKDSKRTERSNDETKKKDNSNIAKVEVDADGDKIFACKYCGEYFKVEDVPTHERLCDQRPEMI